MTEKVAERIIQEFRDGCTPLCDCPTHLDGPYASADAVFRTTHTSACPVEQFYLAAQKQTAKEIAALLCKGMVDALEEKGYRLTFAEAGKLIREKYGVQP